MVNPMVVILGIGVLSAIFGALLIFAPELVLKAERQANRLFMTDTALIKNRIPLGIGAVGGRGSNGSGDIFLAFSTANPKAFNRKNSGTVKTFPNDKISPLFEATVQVVEESIVNAMIAAETMEGINNNKAYALPHGKLMEILKKYNRAN